MKTKVKLRETNEFIDIHITSEDKPKISKFITDKWQDIINLIAEILNVPAGLIMKVTKDHMEVFLKSNNKENPYAANGKDNLGHGLYCETVLASNSELLIENSLKYEVWKDNPDVDLNMISYYGLPLKWDDGEMFGTICVLDNKSNKYSEKYKALMHQMKLTIETDLIMLGIQNELYKISMSDYLTKTYNRRFLVERLSELLLDYSSHFSVIFFDFDRFKNVNDRYGHMVGDSILVQTSKIFSDYLKDGSFIARYGGDEFVVVLMAKNKEEARKFMEHSLKKINTDSFLKNYDISLSYGISYVNNNEITVVEILTEIDDEMLRIKQRRYSNL
jgi:diguanylate cyclase (GGDEF)-like protein